MLLLLFSIGAGHALDRLSTCLWRGNLKRMGVRSTIQHGVTVRYPGMISMGTGSTLSRGVEIGSEFAESECLIGDNVIVGRDVWLDFSGGLEIGDETVISADVRIYTHSHGINPKSSPKKTPLHIGVRVWIGAGASIIEGVESIGDSSIIAAGAVVTKEVPPFTLVAGVPAKVVRNLSPVGL